MSDPLPLDELSETPPKENANRRSVPKHWIVLGSLVFAHAVIGACFNPMGKTVEESTKVGRYMMLGCIFSQPILLAIWAAFAPHRFYHRFLWSLFIYTLIFFSVGLGGLRSGPQDLFYLTIMDLTLFIVAILILLLVRRLSRWQLIHSYSEYVLSDYQANQFGIKHLIILTTITALACGLFRTLIVFSPQLSYPSVAGVAGVTCEVIVMLLPITIIPWFTLADLKNMSLSIFYAIILLGFIDVAVYFIFQNLEPNPDVIQIILFVQLGASISVFVSTLVIRLCGFRMVRERKATQKTLLRVMK
jgi:hypothetical protein